MTQNLIEDLEEEHRLENAIMRDIDEVLIWREVGKQLKSLAEVQSELAEAEAAERD